MYTTICTLLLASTGLASGAQGEVFGNYNGYGSYGAYGCGNGYGGYGGFGRTPPDSTCGEACGVPYFVPRYPYYAPAPYYQVDQARGADSGRKDLEKRVSDLTTILGGHVQKLKTLEDTVERQTGQADVLKQIAQSNKEMHDKLTEALAKINEGSDKKLAEALANFERKVNDAVAAKLADRQPVALDASKQLDELSKRLGEIDAFMRGQKAQESKMLELEARLRSMENRESNIKQEALAQANAEIMHKMVMLLETMAKHNNTVVPALLQEIKVAITSQQPPPPISSPIRGGHPVTRCLLIVHVPADAELYLDGHPSKVGSNLRTFISPDLEPNKNYFYNLKVELKRGDKVYTENQKIYFQPGREYEINFDYLETAIANQLKNVKKD